MGVGRLLCWGCRGFGLWRGGNLSAFRLPSAGAGVHAKQSGVRLARYCARGGGCKPTRKRLPITRLKTYSFVGFEP